MVESNVANAVFHNYYCAEVLMRGMRRKRAAFSAVLLATSAGSTWLPEEDAVTDANICKDRQQKECEENQPLPDRTKASHVQTS